MKVFPSGVLGRWLLLCGGLAAYFAISPAQVAAQEHQSATVRNVVVVGGAELEIQISTSEPMRPQVQLISNPERLILDFPNALPGRTLRTMAVERGEVKGVRAGLFSAAPPVTRIVIDLNSPQPYEVLPSGNLVVVKVGAHSQPQAALSPAALPMPTPRPSRAPKVMVEFRQGLLSIHTGRATLAEVLNEVRRKTGADIPLPAGAESEMVVIDVAPAPPREAMAALLNGSRFNFIVVGSDKGSVQLRSVLLTPRTGGISQPAVSSPLQAPAVASNFQPPPEPEGDSDEPAQPEMQQPQATLPVAPQL